MIASCAVQMSDCVQASQCRPLGWAQPGDGHWQHSENSCAQVLSSADVGQTDTALCLHMVVVCASRLFTCFLCTCCFFVGLPWQPLFCMVIIFASFERLADDGPPEMLWVHATVSIFKRQDTFVSPFIGQDCTWCPGLQFLYLGSIVIKHNETFLFSSLLGLFSLFSCSHVKSADVHHN